MARRERSHARRPPRPHVHHQHRRRRPGLGHLRRRRARRARADGHRERQGHVPLRYRGRGQRGGRSDQPALDLSARCAGRDQSARRQRRRRPRQRRYRPEQRAARGDGARPARIGEGLRRFRPHLCRHRQGERRAHVRRPQDGRPRYDSGRGRHPHRRQFRPLQQPAAIAARLWRSLSAGADRNRAACACSSSA